MAALSVSCYPDCYRKLGKASDEAKTGVEQMARFQPGESGNPKGRPPKRLFDERLKEALGSKRGEQAKLLVQKLIDKASTGNVAALKLVCERVGGKPKSAEALAATPEQAMTLEQVRQRLAELLSRPEVRQGLLAMLETPKDAAVQ